MATTTPHLQASGARTAGVRLGQHNAGDEVASAIERSLAHGGPASPDGSSADSVWISVLDPAQREAAVERAGALNPQLPLAGLTFAVKDNIDLAGLPTTAACPSFAYLPERSATVVESLAAAGATALGKTNLDQFATGLVGARSPYGGPRSIADPSLVSGGSSSGSAIAVARGDVDFALGTDTAGSGRIPAAFNGLVGWKPTRGRLSTSGVVPACRTLDCVSLFTRDVDTAVTVLDALGRYRAAADAPRDALQRTLPGNLGKWTSWWGARRPRIGIAPGALDQIGSASYKEAWARAVTQAEQLGEVVELDLEPFLEAGRLLYEGPWVAERYAAVGEFIDGNPEGLDPTVASIVRGGQSGSAVDAFRAGYRMDELRAISSQVFAGLDAVIVPSAPLHPSAEAVAADPVGINSALGTFTNMVNLLDLCALAVPAEPTQEGLPFGITLWAPAWDDELLLSLGARWGRLLTGELPAAGTTASVVVAGAHMAGLAANRQLLERGGSHARTTATDAGYRLRLLETDQGPRPGLVRDGGAGALPIEVEVWELPVDGLGDLLSLLPSGLAIGPVQLHDGAVLPGFVAAGDERRRLGNAPLLRGWRDHVLAGR